MNYKDLTTKGLLSLPTDLLNQIYENSKKDVYINASIIIMMKRVNKTMLKKVEAYIKKKYKKFIEDLNVNQGSEELITEYDMPEYPTVDISFKISNKNLAKLIEDDEDIFYTIADNLTDRGEVLQDFIFCYRNFIFKVEKSKIYEFNGTEQSFKKQLKDYENTIAWKFSDDLNDNSIPSGPDADSIYDTGSSYRRDNKVNINDVRAGRIIPSTTKLTYTKSGDNLYNVDYEAYIIGYGQANDYYGGKSVSILANWDDIEEFYKKYWFKFKPKEEPKEETSPVAKTDGTRVRKEATETLQATIRRRLEQNKKTEITTKGKKAAEILQAVIKRGLQKNKFIQQQEGAKKLQAVVKRAIVPSQKPVLKKNQIQCECGTILLKTSLKSHLNSVKHKKHMKVATGEHKLPTD